jgi:hypothetical protein
MSLNDRSLSPRKGAVFSELYVLGLSGSRNLLFGGGSRGLGSSRIDFVRLSRLKGFGLLFLVVFNVEVGAVESVETRDTSDFEGPPTGRLVVDLLSTVESKLEVTN